MSFKKTMKKVSAVTLATASLAASALLGGCTTTSKPKVEMDISFNGETYTLEYTLFRKIAPKTVQHFLELADGEFYNGLCVHNYQASKWYTGGYKYEDGNLKEVDYFEKVSTLSLTQSVWYDADRTQPTSMVYGEFAQNDFEVTNGALKQTFGSLTMYYTPKEDVDQKVTVERNDGNGYTKRPYEFNSATSLFFISLSTSQLSDSYYCTFAQLNQDSIVVLEDLQADVKQYIEDEYGADSDLSDFAPSKDVTVNVDDKYADEMDVSYAVPKTPIVIESVKVIKW